MSDLSQAVAWHRQVAALVTAADRAGIATADLPPVRARLLLQQSRLIAEATGIGAALPALEPTPSEIAAVGPAFGDLSAVAVARAVRTIVSTLDAADAALGVPTPASNGTASARVGQADQRGVGLRNAMVYGSFAASVLAVQIGLFMVLDESALALSGPLCLLVLPAFAWLAGYLTIDVAFRPPLGSGAVDRTPRLGAIVCAVPDLVLVAAVGLLFVIDTLTR